MLRRSTETTLPHRGQFSPAADMILSACSEQGGEPVSVTTPSDHVSAAADPSSEQPSAPSTGKRPRNDLRKGHLTRSLRAGDVKITVEYLLRNPVERVVSRRSSTAEVRMTTASQSGQPATDQKIYLSRVTFP